jgi:predicted GNAT family acetyltransferase
MSEHPLDRPVWASLTTHHAHLAHGSALAVRYDPGIIPFVAAGREDAGSLAALIDLVEPGESLYVVQAAEFPVPNDLEVVARAWVVQMLLAKDVQSEIGADFVRLSKADAADMLALATLTKPGPFSLRSGELGEFWGVKRDGKLVAMAGERFHATGFGEVSGVCTHPSVQGQGLGRRLSVWMTSKVLARNETPFLHAFDTNAAAIHLYEKIGFRIRTKLNVTVVRRPA